MQKSSSFTIEIDTSTFGCISKMTDNVTGHIWISCGDEAFPERRWYDFPVIVMGWWIASFCQVYSGKEECCRLVFMDGPFSVILNRSDSTATYVENYKETKVVQIGSFDEAFACCVAAAKEIIQFGSKQGWRNKDFIFLRDMIDSVSSQPHLRADRSKFRRSRDN